MFSVVFPGQGSQKVGMGKIFYERYDLVKNYFNEADETLNFPISKLVLEGPKSDLDLTFNTQPAIFLISYSIFNVIKKEFNIDLNKANFFAGHSLGEYTALSCAGYIKFSDTLKILKLRGEAMQNAVPKGIGGMIAILATTIKKVENIIFSNKKNCDVQIANDNSEDQIVVSGKLKDLDFFAEILKSQGIRNIKLPVSAPFHCKLMNEATKKMRNEINKLEFNMGYNVLMSNVTANSIENIPDIKNLLIKQIESRVRWRESIINMTNNGVDNFIEIGPGKVLSGLIKRINKNVKVQSINNEEDIKNLTI
ncbi:MAG: [acyl-carrier-protein] S-malonyltransferase [Pelagibacterales bacterium MED-G44]|nr:MAG: [acyl-carrier-protein] S-malonyltransferase [Pelagibacterales bacterium MED-G44]